MTDKPSRATVFDTATAGSALSEIGDAVRTRLVADRGDLAAGGVTLVREVIEVAPADSFRQFVPGAVSVIRS